MLGLREEQLGRRSARRHLNAARRLWIQDENLPARYEEGLAEMRRAVDNAAMKRAAPAQVVYENTASTSSIVSG